MNSRSLFGPQSNSGVVSNAGTVELGGTGIQVPRLFLGCASFEGMGSAQETWGQYGMDAAQAQAYLSRGVSLGITVLDTACSYAGGASERIIGDWLKGRWPGETIISTKVGLLVEPELHVDLSRRHILDEIRGSLDRLGIERLDLYLAHAPDAQTPVAQTLETFAMLLEAGTVRAIGACNITAVELREALDEAERLGLPRYEWVQNEYHLLNPSDALDVIPLCQERGLGYTPHTPLCGGVLSGKYAPEGTPPPGSRLAALPQRYAAHMTDDALRGVQRLGREAARLGVSTAALALAWVMADQGVAATIVAPSSPAQFDDVVQALELRLDADQREQLLRTVKNID
jgi:aryl-alcohol dehydrogenase-like predicted oxidoreductase